MKFYDIFEMCFEIISTYQSKKIRMKRLQLLLLLLITQQFIFSQNNAISRFINVPRHIEHSGLVKCITVNDYSFKINKEAADTTKTVNKFFFNKRGGVIRVLNFRDAEDEPWQIIEYDNKGRVQSIYRKNNDGMSLFAKQFYNNFSDQPDSLNIYRGEKRKSDQYINRFHKKLLVKQEYFTQDTLRSYNTYQYDKKNRLIKESFINTKNGWGITIGKSITGNKNEKSFYPNDDKTYEYSKIKDTTFITKTNVTPKHTYKEVTKELKTNNFSLEIKDKYDNDFLIESKHNYTSKDSIYYCSYYYKDNKKISRFYKTITKPNIQIGTWNSDVGVDQESTQIVNIDTLFDKFNNWIRKAYSTENKITQLIIREIEYF
jgi:hypothetical protein